jgi:beta-N-acetylhexosaminidase
MIRKAIIISIGGPFLTGREAHIIQKEKPWGIILFKRNILSESQLINLTTKIKKITKDKKFPILLDEEGGRVSRISNFLDNSIYSQEYLGLIYKLNKKIGKKLYETYINSLSKVFLKTGININTSPVLDLKKKHTHKIIGNRSYSTNSNIVNELGKLCIKFYKSNKIGTVIKHMPGHGSADTDSHFKLPNVNNSLASLKKTDFKCFKKIPSFFGMTGHILYTQIDKKNNVTHSSKIIKNIIRKEIGFKGILISDDISMKALKYDLIRNARLALNAGCNLVLYCAGKTNEAEKLLKSVPYTDKFTTKKTSEFYKFLS